MTLGLFYFFLPASVRAQDPQQALQDRIEAEIRAGRLDAALDQARLAVGQYPESPSLNQLLGATLFKKGLNEEARTAFRRAIDLDPSLPQNYYNLALVELSEHRYAQAVAPLETYLRLNPQDGQAHLFLGRAYHNLNRTLPAIEQFKKALSLDSDLPLAHYHLGYAYQSLGDLKAALEEYRKEIRINPAFYDSYWLAGNIELDQGNLDAAEAFFRKGVSLKEQAFQAHYGLARMQLAKKRYPNAEAEFKKALETSPDNVEVHYALARAYQQMGRKEDAKREYQLCVALHARGQKQRSGIAGTALRP
jgi:protein O-GlcNAc transferase